MVEEILPLGGINDDEFSYFITQNQFNSLSLRCVSARISIDEINKIVFRNFEGNNYKSLNKLDPDENFFSCIEHSLEKNCKYVFEEEFNNTTSDDCFCIGVFNINSLPKDYDDLNNLLIDNNGNSIDILGLCETRLSTEIDQLFSIDNYNMYANSRSRNGGGVALYVRDTMHGSFLRNEFSFSFSYLESLFVEMPGLTGKNILVGVIYRPPNSNFLNFYNKILEILEIITNENKIIYLIGDFNVDLSKCNQSSNTKKFINLLFSHNLFSSIVKPTRVTRYTATFIGDI